MKCPECQFENVEGAKFCRKCGHKQEILCSECGNALPPDSVFCQECGHDLRQAQEPPPIDYSQPQSYTPKYLAEKILTTRSSIEGERKLVTVLFADVANYTSIAEKLDPEEVHQIMDGCFKILMDQIHRYEGTINQFTGDGVMALFGAPVAHEDHAQRACHAALSIQKAIGGYGQKVKNDYDADFKMRIGLNSGAVIVGSIGDDLRMDYTAVGDTSNLAFRMQDIANPGSVLASGNTHRMTRAYFEFQSVGELEIKGKEELQDAYELIRPTEVETRIEAAALKGLTRFVGRKQELEALKQAFEKVSSGSGQVLGIVGEAGVGKSRLILELKNMILETEHSYLEGRCLHYGSSMPYLPILDVLKGYFGIEEEDREATIKKKLRNRFFELDEKAEVVPPALHEVLSLKVQDEKYVQLSPPQRRERTFEVIRDLLIRESQKTPLILVVEDLHWIDTTSKEFLDYLIGSLPTARILLILLYRPEYTHQWGSKSYYGKIGLNQLSTKTSAELVQAILKGGDVAPEIGGLILGRAGGNPLFVEELTHSLVENGSIQKKDDHFVLARKPSEIEVPDTIQGIIAARMDRVEENLKRIMQVASVIGREFAYKILATITGMKEDLKASLLNLQGLEFIYEKQLFPELEYIFKHALTQEVAYNSLLLNRRKEIHEKIGRAMEEIYAERLEEYYDLLAYHYAHSENRDKAVDYLVLARQRAVKAYGMEDAMACFEHAMMLLDAMPDTKENRERRISLLTNQYIVFVLLFRHQDFYDLMTRYEPLVAKIDDAGLKGAFYAHLGSCHFTFGYFDKAIETATQAAELGEAAGNAETAGYAYQALGAWYFFKGDMDKALTFREHALRKMEEHLDLRSYVWALLFGASTFGALGRWREAEEDAQKALSVAQDYSDNSLITQAAMSISGFYSGKGDLDRAFEYAEMAYQKAPTPLDKALAQNALATAWLWADEPAKAIQVLEPFLQVVRAGDYAIGEIMGLEKLAAAYLSAGQYDQARQTAQDLLAFAERCGSKLYVGDALSALGWVMLETEPPYAAPHFERAISIFREIKAEAFLVYSYWGYGLLHKRQGRMAEARQYLTQALQIFEKLGHLINPDKVKKELAELPQ
ncbi:MAG: guanylate cyclase [Nitrospira bacterium SG8_3]|nr:MAG: guanylate cyclase [Nitrospira bacterium SG8_3]